MYYQNKNITLALLCCIILLILGLIIYKFLDIISTFINGKIKEHFDNKRSRRMKIYKSDEIKDPDENPEYNDNDPDVNPELYDPDH